MAEAFDYVIVGGGSAGCVLAHRLSENADVTICLIEAGPRNRHPYIHVPLGLVALMYHKTLNWNFTTTPQEHAGARRIPIPRGKTLGGSSSINGMVYIRGHRLDYDDWRDLGCPGWSFSDVLPYFCRAERNEALKDSPYHGSSGPLSVVDPDKPNPLNEVFLEATEQLQYRRRRDFNDDDQEGFGIHQLTQKHGIRESTATAYLDPVRHRPNLKIVTGGAVSRVLFDHGRASAVEIMRNGHSRTISAQREIILSAGAINSPAILMRSGIGHPAELARHGIPVLHPAPSVGRNLQDHMGLGIHYESNDIGFYGISWRAVPSLIGHGLDYIFRRRGLLASNIVEACGFLRTAPGLDRPDIQYAFMPARRGEAARLIGYGHGYGLVSVLLKPKSRGTVRLTSANPHAAAAIDLNAFAEPDDMATLLRGYKISRRILEAPAFKDYGLRERLPGAHVQSDADLEAYIRNVAGTIYHPTSTARMGSDEGAVVDPELRVKGVQGLRVVDASIMPTIVGGNTNAPTIMIAEKASDMIRGKAPLPAVSLP